MIITMAETGESENNCTHFLGGIPKNHINIVIKKMKKQGKHVFSTKKKSDNLKSPPLLKTIDVHDKETPNDTSYGSKL